MGTWVQVLEDTGGGNGDANRIGKSRHEGQQSLEVMNPPNRSLLPGGPGLHVFQRIKEYMP